MKTVFLLTQVGTNVIFDTVFTDKQVAEQKIKDSLEADEYDAWKIIELKLI